MEKSRESLNNNPQNKNSVFTSEVKLLSKKKYFLNNVLEGGKKILLWVLDLVVSIFLSLGHFFLTVGVGIYKGALGVINFFKRKVHQFKYNDVYGRISFGVFGVSNIKNKQYVNGALYIIFEIAYIVLFALFGVPALMKLPTLGPAGQQCVDGCGTMFEEIQIVGNSILILIFGLLWLFSLFIFLFVWNKSINSGYNLYRIKHFVIFDNFSKDCLNFSNKISDLVIKEYAEGVKKGAFRKKYAEEINSYLTNIQINKDNVVDAKHRVDYTKYLINLTIHDAYAYCNAARKLDNKIAKLLDNKNTYTENRAAKLQSLGYKEGVNDIQIQKYSNRTLSTLSKKEIKITKVARKRSDLDKRYSCSADRQNTLNNNKYGKFNDYFKHIADIDNKVLFWSNYEKFVGIYSESLLHSDEQNEKNMVQGRDLAESTRLKIENINHKFEAILSRRVELENELVLVKHAYNEKVLAIKAGGKDPNELLEAKAVLVEETTKINRSLNDLPNAKNINTMRKEEVKEVKHAYHRDRRYLKTNFTPEAYAKQCVIDNMLLEYKMEYALARKFTEILYNNILKNITPNPEEEINALKEAKETYIEDNKDKYVGKPLTFIEQLKGLLNQNFHITILLLPLVGIVLFTIIPLIFSILIAFTNYSSNNQPHVSGFNWIGLDNFFNIFGGNGIYGSLPAALGQMLGWTLIWAVAATFSNYILGIIVALMINKNGIKFKKLWRTIFVLTIAVPQFISLLSIATLIKDTGALGQLYFDIFGSKLGFATSNNVLGTKIIIILVNVWVGIPYTILSTTGILLNIPKDLYESSTVDGAGAFTQFTRITMPYILFVTGPYLITQFVGNINNFNVIFFLTGGEPSSLVGNLFVGKTDLLITFLYDLIISGNNAQFGIASTIGIAVFIICSFFSIIMYNKTGAIKEEDTFQ